MNADPISTEANPIESAIWGAVEANSEPTTEQTEVATEVEGAPAVAEAVTQPVDDVKAAPEAAKVEDEEAALKALEKELIDKTPTMARGRIGVSRHQAVLTRNRNKWDEEKKALTAQIETLKKSSDDPVMKGRLELLKIAQDDPPRFFGALKTNAQYQALIRAEAEAIAKTIAKESTPAAEVKAPVDDKAPEPDVLLADGRVTYSAEQMLKYNEWVTRQLTGKFNAELEKVRGEVKPIADEREHQKQLSAAFERQTKLIAQAEKDLPGFTENKAKIGELMRRPESIQAGMSIYEAYARIVPSQIEAAKAAAVTAAEKKAVESLQQRVPKETVRPGSVPVVKADKEPESTGVDMEAIIRRSIKQVA